MKTKEANRHEFSYYERCEREVQGLREYLVHKGFGVECATEGVANTAIGLLRALFDGMEPVAPVSANFTRKWEDLQEWESPDQVPGGLPRGNEDREDWETALRNDLIINDWGQ